MTFLEPIVERILTGVIVGTHCCKNANRGTLLQTIGTKVIVGEDCCNSVNRGHCCNQLLQQYEPRSLLKLIVTMRTETIVGSHCNNELGSHCCNNVLGYDYCL
jgi:hypothetical protein